MNHKEEEAALLALARMAFEGWERSGQPKKWTREVLKNGKRVVSSGETPGREDKRFLTQARRALTDLYRLRGEGPPSLSGAEEIRSALVSLARGPVNSEDDKAAIVKALTPRRRRPPSGASGPDDAPKD